MFVCCNIQIHNWVRNKNVIKGRIEKKLHTLALVFLLNRSGGMSKGVRFED